MSEKTKAEQDAELAKAFEKDPTVVNGSSDEEYIAEFPDRPKMAGKDWYHGKVISFTWKKEVKEGKEIRLAFVKVQIQEGDFKGYKFKHRQQVNDDSQYFTGSISKACGVANMSTVEGKNAYPFSEKALLNKFVDIQVEAQYDEDKDTTYNNIVGWRVMKDEDKNRIMGL